MTISCGPFLRNCVVNMAFAALRPSQTIKTKPSDVFQAATPFDGTDNFLWHQKIKINTEKNESFDDSMTPFR